MDKHNLSTTALQDIARMIARYLNKQINPASIYKYDEHTSFGQHSNILNANVGISYYHNRGAFQGSVNGGGSFSGTVSSGVIYISCSKTSNSTSISF